ncbi:dTMP kinase [Arcanobacterium pluranimalium]|uniref:dTMP kinase n=1 Tax=Arcanobacterium pluranimalium TaxID=108028 RepID=UPI00195E66C9|nr:dTMP kinase [Arcanobacterium pluranimalium]MBM7824512.1 dTMP kinase [Arcanobacterium pluranimalium]
MSGLFISFEGGDGAGKSTQVNRLVSWLEERGREVVSTREPGGTELGAKIRELLLHGDHVAPRAEALLFAADRAHHVESKIRPALNRGAVVITDRYFDSSVAYQGAARALNAQQVRDLSIWAVEGLLPHVTILLDVPAQRGAARIEGELDRMEQAGAEFHERVRDEFLQLAKQEPQRFVVIDGTQSIDAIALQIQAVVEPLL